jgi:dihydroxy-acid dehydratase
MPSGKYLMEDFYYAGGLPVIIKELGNLLHQDSITVNGKSFAQNYGQAVNYNDDVIRTLSNPLLIEGGSVVCKGNLAPNGAVIKPSAATPALLKHIGRAVVFEDIEDYHAKIDDPDLDVDENCILVLKNVGPKGYPGMPEVGNMGLPRKLLDKGIKDMIRISDGRMSGTAFGAVFLHVSPEAAVGGTLALVKDGDIIEVNVYKRLLQLNVSEEELAKRRALWKAPEPAMKSGYVGMYIKEVMGADKGADLEFLVGKRGSNVTRDSH